MDRKSRVVSSALVVIAGSLALAGAATPAVAQRPRVGRAGQPTPQPTVTTPYPGATIFVPPTWYVEQRYSPQFRRHHRAPFVVPPVVYYYPVPSGYPYYQGSGYGGGVVYDANGRPLSSGFDDPAPTQYDYPAGTPDLSGSPYLVLEGGTMLVEFGNGDRRMIPSCAASTSARDPNGRPRTIFYEPAGSGLVLRAGARGRVRGAPTAGGRVCYGADAYGRVELRY